MDTTKIEFGHEHDVQKRYFLKKTLQLGVVSGIASMAFLSDCKEEEKEDVSPPEDLMREHGILNRVLLVYDFCKTRLINKESFRLKHCLILRISSAPL